MTKVVKSLNELSQDLAGRHMWTKSTGTEDIDPAVIDNDLKHLLKDGYVIIQDLLTHEELQTIKENINPLLNHTGRNTFEGIKTQRVYNVLAKTRVADKMAQHPRVLAILDRILLQNYLLSQMQVIKILPGENAQLLHTDDGQYTVPRPRKAIGAATVWAIDDFTASNGATSVVPGSHLWDGERIPLESETIPCVMPAGSAVVFLGTLWHGGGANYSDSARLGFTCQYCEPRLRQQENFMMEVPLETAKELSEDLLRMMGYSIFPPFFGMVNGMHPKRLLEHKKTDE
ncbi:phytanoyl-CoA dioxygenase family protein [Acinetobacter tianfuensis]|uniref:Phytanoyl-CoA dioxygenase family protein n=1 Tax=Acinetobacter tianfuensis TaxID=2419603 RepID=A0A3A8E7U3_9GAMM|nr:phytanoyl-CoA dioxygenase family protein [Acinetobacter tianfuensis]RKG29646.1 phytanoyl-CoA dioxygenase family protein [Acinetobacter tianfuensis]